MLLLGAGLSVSACTGQGRLGCSRGSEAEADKGSAAAASEDRSDPSQPSEDFRGSMGAPPVPPNPAPRQE